MKHLHNAPLLSGVDHLSRALKDCTRLHAEDLARKFSTLIPAIRWGRQTCLLLCLLFSLPFSAEMSWAQIEINSISTQTDKASPNKAAVSKDTGNVNSKTVNVVGYNKNIRQEDFKGLSKEIVLQMQKQLESIYKDLNDWQHDYALKGKPLDDGIVGPITLSWLQRFGFSFKVYTGEGYAPGLAKNVDRIARFGEKNRAELGILLSPEFEAWDFMQPEKTKNQDFQIRRQGTDKELIDLVNRFRGMRKIAPRSAPNFVDTSAYFVYNLNQADLDVLVGKDQIIQVLTTLKDKEFNSSEALRSATAQAMGGREYLLKQIWPLIARNAADFDGYLVNEDALKRLKEVSDFPVAVIDELRLQGTIYFKNRELFDSFLEEKLNTDALFLTDDEKRAVAEAARVFDNIHLTEQSLATIKNELKGNIQNTGVPAMIVKLLEQIKDVDYAEIDLFRSAAVSKIVMGIGACRLNSPSNNAYVSSLRMSDDDFALLQKELEALKAQAPDGRNRLPQSLESIFTELNQFRLQVGLCDDNSVTQAQSLIQQLYHSYLAIAIENVAKKRIPEKLNNITLKGGDCGCALDEFNGIVYGFYPYWKNQQKTQTVNFSVLNRVAYYGLTVDNVGELKLGANAFDIRNGSAKDNEFIRTARQYNSKVDWLIQKNDWSGDWRKFSRENKQAVLKKLIQNIAGLLRAPLNDISSRIKPYASFGISSRPTRGDGVTIYFPNYPLDADSALLFNEFYFALRKELANDDVLINLLVSQDNFVNNPSNKSAAFGLSNLVKLRKKSDSRGSNNKLDKASLRELILVLLNEPSTDSKKQLRRAIEGETSLHGADRSELLRHLLPVLHFDNRNWQQLEDDILYAGDNFGGIGFWSPNFDNLAKPVIDLEQSCLQSQQIAVCLLKNYRPQEIVEDNSSTIEKFVCVSRWYLQLVLTLFVLLAILLAYLFARYCEIQNFVKRYFLWIVCSIVIPPLVIFTLLLLFDPYLASLSQGNLPFIISVVILVAGILAGYSYLKSRRELPLRQRALPQRQGLGFPLISWSKQLDEAGFRVLIRNRGTGFAIIKKIEIYLDGQAVADAKTALEAVFGPNNNLVWRAAPLVGQKIMPGESLLAISINDPSSALAFDKKLAEHELKVLITYYSASHEYWISDGKEVSAVAGNFS